MEPLAVGSVVGVVGNVLWQKSPIRILLITTIKTAMQKRRKSLNATKIWIARRKEKENANENEKSGHSENSVLNYLSINLIDVQEVPHLSSNKKPH